MRNLNYKNRGFNKSEHAKGTTFNYYYYQEEAPSIKEKHDGSENYSIFSLLLQGDSAGLFCSYGDISTYVMEDEIMFPMNENEVLYMNLTYQKGLHILKSLGYEKQSSKFMPYDIELDDGYDNSNAIYYEENWKRIS